MNNHPQTLSFLATAARLADALELLDTCHAAASEGQLETPNARAQAELVALLHEIAFVANEAARELEAAQATPQFRLIKRGSRPSQPPTSADDAPERDEQPFRLIVADDDTSNPLYIVKQAGG